METPGSRTSNVESKPRRRSKRSEETSYDGELAERATKSSRGLTQIWLVGAWRSRVTGQAAESAELLASEANLVKSLVGQGKNAPHGMRRLPTRFCARYIRLLCECTGLSIRTRGRLQAIWLHVLPANMPMLHGSTKRCSG